MPELIAPTARLRDSWLDAREEWGSGAHQDGSGLTGVDDVDTARRCGLATWALGEVLPKARARGIDRVLVTCAVDNVASARTIERNGGVLEDVCDTELGRVRRYWIDLYPSAGDLGE